MSWRDDRACIDVPSAVFFVDVGASTNRARLICASCPVRAECLEYALANREEYGVWGGLAPRERRSLVRGRRRRAVSVCGTTGGYAAHRRRGEATCEACRQANAAYWREHKARVAS